MGTARIDTHLLTWVRSTRAGSALWSGIASLRESRYTTLIVTTFTAVHIASSKSPAMNPATCRTNA
jgi:hypothetical protein